MPRDDGKKLSLPHQAEGTAFLRANERAALFDEQGLGKSKQLIDAVAAEIAHGGLAGALIICPNGLKTNWAAEIESFCSLPYAVFGAGRSARRSAFGSLRAAFYVINYEAVDAELPSLRALLRFKPMALVLDESHRIKTPGARVTKAVLQLRAQAKRRYIMTGTPVANRPEDLWSQFLFLDDGSSLGATFEEFKTRYCAAGGGYKAVSDLRDRVSSLSMRRLKEGTVDLPPKQVHRVFVDMEPRQAAMYGELRNELALWVSAMDGTQVLKQAEAILARLVRLAQLASNPALLDAAYGEDACKLVALDALLETYLKSPQQKVIVWTSFTDNVAALKRRYRDHSPVTLYGAMSTPERDDAVRRFRHDPAVRIMIANPAAAREGLTLTEANVAIYVDRTFNLVDYLQSQDRIHRISQTRPCEIILLIANASVDAFVDFSLEQKHRLAKYAQTDSDEIAPADLALEKPDVLRALMWPEGDVQEGTG
jgi:SWI/SNF-related matrix-associated actin-dependent regulator 1 of chromatin subfamily A